MLIFLHSLMLLIRCFGIVDPVFYIIEPQCFKKTSSLSFSWINFVICVFKEVFFSTKGDYTYQSNIDGIGELFYDKKLII